MKKKILITISIIILILVAAVIGLDMYISYDPNILLKLLSKPLPVGQTQEVTYKYVDSMLEMDPVLNYSFIPEKSTEYKFELTDFHDDNNECIGLYVIDEDLSDYLILENYDSSTGEMSDAIEGEVFLEKSKRYYVIFDFFLPGDKDKGFDSSGSFKLTVEEASEEDDFAEIAANGSVDIDVDLYEQECVIFHPSETAYYEFDADIVSKEASAGFASIVSVNAEDKTSIKLREGICYLEAGKEYYVWVAANETAGKKAEVRVNCTQLASDTVTGLGTVNVSGNTLIVYKADADEQIVVYSNSEGDPKASIYNSAGFKMRTDDNSGGSLSINEKDFAMVFGVNTGKIYWICVEGDLSDCKVHIARYIGDGSSLTVDDIELPQETVADGNETTGDDDSSVTDEDGTDQ